MKMQEVWELFKQENPNQHVQEVLEFIRVNRNNYMQRYKLLIINHFDEQAVLRESNLKRNDIEQVKALFTRYYMLGIPKVKVN